MCGTLQRVVRAPDAERREFLAYALSSPSLKRAAADRPAAAAAPSSAAAAAHRHHQPPAPSLLASWETFVQKSCGWGMHRRVVSHMNPNAAHVRRVFQEVAEANPGFAASDEERMTQATVKIFEAVALMRNTLENVRNAYRRVVQMSKALEGAAAGGEDGVPGPPPPPPESLAEPLRRCVQAYQRADPLTQYRRVFEHCMAPVQPDLRASMLRTLDTEVRRLCDTLGSEGDRLAKIYACVDAALRTGGPDTPPGHKN